MSHKYASVHEATQRQRLYYQKGLHPADTQQECTALKQFSSRVPWGGNMKKSAFSLFIDILIILPWPLQQACEICLQWNQKAHRALTSHYRSIWPALNTKTMGDLCHFNDRLWGYEVHLTFVEIREVVFVLSSWLLASRSSKLDDLLASNAYNVQLNPTQ